MTKAVKGACHCGKVTWQYQGDIDGVTACNCTLCRRYGALWIYGHEGEEIQISGDSAFYTRGRGINGFHFCQTCGCTTHYKARSPNDKGLYRVAVNIRTAKDPEQIMALPIDHFDGLDKFEDLPRDDRCVKDLWF